MATPVSATKTAVVDVKDLVAGYLPGVNILNGTNLVAHQGELIGIIVGPAPPSNETQRLQGIGSGEQSRRGPSPPQTISRRQAWWRAERYTLESLRQDFLTRLGDRIQPGAKLDRITRRLWEQLGQATDVMLV